MASVAEPEMALMERLARLMRAAEHEGGLNPAQWEALRFVARANRFSNSPGALTRFLGATKGTVSQTVMALERKGFIVKARREGEGRSVTLALTAAGEAMLARDPWGRLQGEVERLGPKTRKRLAKGLRDLLRAELERSGLEGFGVCRTCRYFGEKGAEAERRGPHRCLLFEVPLSAADTRRICVEHLPV